MMLASCADSGTARQPDGQAALDEFFSPGR
jgi:hypothetical protein